MTRDDVISMAREAGIEVHPRKDEARFGVDALLGNDSTPKLERFAALVATAPLWAFMHTGCIYESAFAVVSLHRTKAAAWRAMHTAQWNAWIELQHSQRMPRGEGWGRDRGAKAYEHEASKVQRMEVTA